MKKQIMRISIIQSSKMIVAMYAGFGLIYTFIGILLLLFADDPIWRGFAIFYIFGPIWMGAIGFVFFAVFAALYNFLASQLGGFEIEVKDIHDEASNDLR
ncbi:MAG: hypothetical protein QGF98_02395 [Candidatus Poseidoniia archaeon]|nr:hypothetical protein [Candidatus Poseidoniia archaeon]